MNEKYILKIVIYSRGKNIDEYGNPYHAFKAIIHVCHVSYFNTITVSNSMSYGDSSERDCLMWALQGINEALGINIRMDDERIEHHHKHVYRFQDLEHPEKWKS